MAAWMNAAALCARYMVSEVRLDQYARRGDLAMRATREGALFDEERVASIFRRRGEDAATVGFGVLGRARLGEPSRAPATVSTVVRCGEPVAVVIPLAPRVPRFA